MRLRHRIRHMLHPALGGRLRARRKSKVPGTRIPFVGWLYYVLAACCTPLLIVVGIVVFLPSLGMLLLGYQPGFVYLGYAVGGLVLAGMVVARFARPHLVVGVETPLRVECGQSFTMRYHVQNAGRWPAFDVVLESMVYPNPAELRMKIVMLPFLASGAEIRLTGRGQALRRGCYQLPPLRWDCRFPLGIWRSGQTDWQRQRHLAVFPRVVRMDALDIPMGARNRQETHTARHLSRSALEFHGCREFRPGDVVRHLHARSSARMGVPVIKEFQAEGHGRTAVIVDTLGPSWRTRLWQLRPDPHCEAVLSQGASVVEYLARQDHVVELLVAGAGVYRFESAGNMGFFQEVLDILAAVEPVFADPLPLLQPVLVDEIGAIQSVCLVLGSWSAKRAALVRELVALQVGVKLILVQPQKPRQWGADFPEHTRFVRVQDVQRGSVRVL